MSRSLTPLAGLARLMKTRAAGMTGLAFLLFVLAATPASASMMLSCYLARLSGPHPSGPPRDRGCTFQVAWVAPSPDPDPNEIVNRAFSCVVRAGDSSCSLIVEPREYGVPAEYILKSVGTAPLYSPDEEADGCVYSTYLHENLQGRYPLIFSPGDPPDASLAFPYSAANPIVGSASATNPFPIVLSPAPAPSLPDLPAGSSSTLRIVVLHYFDCANIVD